MSPPPLFSASRPWLQDPYGRPSSQPGRGGHAHFYAGYGKERSPVVASADWQSWVRDMQTTALSIRAAAKTKDSVKFSAAADHLSEICQSCHTKYRPQAPSDGVARYPFYPKREPAQ